MPAEPEIIELPNTPFMAAVIALLEQIDATIPESFTGTVTAFVTGGVAVHAYTASRTSRDLGAKFEPPLLLRQEPVVRYIDADKEEYLRLDRSFFAGIGLVHPDWEDSAKRAGKYGRIEVRIMAPVDLAVSKVSRFEDNDRADIRALASLGLVEAGAFERRCLEAIDYYVGEPTFVRHNIAEAVDLVRSCSPPISSTP